MPIVSWRAGIAGTSVAILVSVGSHASTHPSGIDAPRAPHVVARSARNLPTPREIRKLLDEGRYPAAESTAVRLVAGLDSRQPIDSAEVAGALELLVDALANGGKFLEGRTLDAADRALGIRRAIPGPDSLAFADALFALGTVLDKRDQDSAAAVVYARVAGIRERALGPNDPAVATALHDLARQQVDLNQLAEAESLLRRAASIRERTLGIGHRDYARTLAVLAVVTAMRGNGDSALYQHALEVTERAVGPDHPILAQHLIWYGSYLRNQFLFDRAHACMGRAVEIYERALGPNNLLTARAIHLTGVNLVWSTRYERALPYYRRALEITASLLGTEHIECARSMMGLGDIYQRLGDETKARPYLEKALAICERDLPPSDPLLAHALDDLCADLLVTGEDQRAQSLCARGLEIRRRISPGSMDVARSMDHLAQCYGDSARSFPLYREAAQIYCEVFGPESPLAGRGSSLFGIMDLNAGRTDEAIRWFKRSIPIFERSRPGELGWAELALGRALLQAERPGEATQHFERAVRAFEVSLGPLHTTTGMALKALGTHWASLGETDSACRALLRAEAIRRAHLGRNVRVLEDSPALRLRTGYANARAASLDVLISLAVADPRRAPLVWDSVIRSRAFVLDEMATRQRALHARADPRVRMLAAEYDSLGRRLSNLEWYGPPVDSSERRRNIERLSREREAVARTLAERSSVFRDQQHRAELGLVEIARELPPASALIAYVHYRPFRKRAGVTVLEEDTLSSYAAFVLPGRDLAPRVVALGEVTEVERAVEAWKREASRGATRDGSAGSDLEDRYRQAGERLRRLIWDPVGAHLQGIERVFVVPEGPLHLLNLATLPVGPSVYWVERGPLVHYLSAERDLAVPPSHATFGNGLLALGAPDFDCDPQGSTAAMAPAGSAAGVYRGPRSACADFQGLRFKPLQQSEAELGDIANLWQELNPQQPSDREGRRPSEVLSGARATEAAFKALAPGCRALHLATHGFFLGEGCGASESNQRGIGGIKNAEPPRNEPDNPLVLSGLALAGANRRDHVSGDAEDGILTAEEIAVMDLSSVEWAVLSACESGVGEIHAGEGVLGLRRALRIAGVRTAILSLWEVDDQATRRWMRSLYEGRWRLRLDASRSVRQASLSVLDERRRQGLTTHPASWGAFIAVGDWR
jgi:CHAT domain-containing protein/tetratricopeptide (TPR) repeat protein